MIDRRLIVHFDWVLFFCFLLLTCIGIVNLYSATHNELFASNLHPHFVKQLIWIGIGFILFVIMLLFDYHHLQTLAPFLYFCGLVLLLMVLLIGQVSHGASRWLGLGIVRFQPSELEKIIMVIAVSAWGSSDNVKLFPSFGRILPFIALNIPPFLLIAMEPDLGTAVLICLISGTMLFAIGIRKRWVIIALLLFSIAAVPVWERGLKDYQKQRILAALNPDRDPQRSGYHILQSRIAIGSGMVWGRGYLKGTQNKLKFLPEKHTDFAFSVWAEEWGFVGSVGLISIFGLFIYRGFNTVLTAKDRFGALLCLGFTSIFLWEILINIGMVLGLLPVVGVPLPFISYGGSSFIGASMAIGLIENVTMRRYAFRSY